MNASELLDEVLGHIRLIKEDKEKLETLLEFIKDQLFDDEPNQPEEIPQQFEKVINPIAQAIDAGMICYLNTDTAEIEEFHPDLFEFEDEDEEIEDELSLKHHNWSNCFQIEPLEPQESFEIMSDFVMQLKDIPMQIKLLNVLDRKKPFANFKRVIDNSNHRKSWFEFKNKALEKYVRTQLYLHFTYGTGEKTKSDSVKPEDLPF
ncbi:MAG: hypothetical protein GZ091_06225 [Paludibacter sp.]|nr:hypothetical protein [Paludibacter sp.]